ncbi:MAG: primosomal protein N' [Candidatus Marinimicrobia bacterium]|nr:primosomal protein N' [Candidatus Neomarinimicrobiota bacterium]
MYAHITFPVYSFQSFTYKIPKKLTNQINTGVCVKVSFRNKTTLGYVVQLSQEVSYKGKILPIDSIYLDDYCIEKELWETLIWTKNYYLAPLGQIIKLSIPTNFNKKFKSNIEKSVSITKKGISEIFNLNKMPAQKKILVFLRENYDKEIKIVDLSKINTNYSSICKILIEKKLIQFSEKQINPFKNYTSHSKVKTILNDEQKKAYTKIANKLNKKSFSPFYLKGVTGSGKTEVYLKLAVQALKKNKSVIILVPEIALTPTVFNKFFNVFGNKVGLWHSRLTNSEKGWVWQKLVKKEIKVIVGARSAIYLPISNLGLIVIDEEQESSYKQENPSPRYNARDVALVRAKLSKSTVVLTSATPSLESYYNYINNKFDLIQLKERYGGSVYPDIKLINMKLHKKDEFQFNRHISKQIINDLKNCISNNEQAILLHNRRGYANIQMCKKCEWIFECKHCSTSLKYHKVGNMMLCHHCNYKTMLSQKCLNCGCEELIILGYGTQKIEDEIIQFIPEAKIVRMDMDTSKYKGGHFHILDKFKNQDFNILLGTQMIAKGLDFENVTFVGIINADVGLFLPDFRAGEKIFQLIYQVAGRAGRRKKRGLVSIQTYNADDVFIRAASNLDLDKFYKIALKQRKELFYPPFNRVTRILFKGKNKKNILQLVNIIFNKIKLHKFNIIGPSIAPIEKLNGLWRYHLLVKIDQQKPYSFQNFFVNKLGLKFLEKSHNGVRISLDIDPITML